MSGLRCTLLVLKEERNIIAMLCEFGFYLNFAESLQRIIFISLQDDCRVITVCAVFY